MKPDHARIAAAAAVVADAGSAAIAVAGMAEIAVAATLDVDLSRAGNY
jgi:hypothetical protein